MVLDRMDWAQEVCEGKDIEDYLGLIVTSNRGVDDELEAKREEYYNGILLGIANSMLSKRITDDVKSSNGLSPLDQVIMFYLGYMQKNRLKVIKNNIYSLYKSWEGGSSIPNIEYSRLIKNFPKIFP
jgi:hypothetical protein